MRYQYTNGNNIRVQRIESTKISYHICNLIFFPSNSIVLILKSIPEMKYVWKKVYGFKSIIFTAVSIPYERQLLPVPLMYGFKSTLFTALWELMTPSSSYIWPGTFHENCIPKVCQKNVLCAKNCFCNFIQSSFTSELPKGNSMLFCFIGGSDFACRYRAHLPM